MVGLSTKRRFRAYLAPGFFVYTLLVTCLLVQTWDDTSTLWRRWQRQKALPSTRYMPTEEERRHLRRLEDVDGNPTSDNNNKEFGSQREREMVAFQNGRRAQGSVSDDFYVDASGPNGTEKAHTGIVNNGVHLRPPGNVNREGTQKSEEVIGPQGKEKKRPENLVGWRKMLLGQVDVEIEEMIPNTDINNNSNNVIGSMPWDREDRIGFQKNQHRLFKDRKPDRFQKANSKSSKEGRSLQSPARMPIAQFCENVEEGGHLCYRERVVFSHGNHVNISDSHLSFQTFAGLIFYSAFLDTRTSPAIVRLMTIGPLGFSNGPSNLWCSFTSPLAVTQQFDWTGQERGSHAHGQVLASQLYFYAASNGHGKSQRFYVISCRVPDVFLPTLSRFEGNQMDLVVGPQDLTRLGTIQERLTLTVVNNKGLSVQALREQVMVKARHSQGLPLNLLELSRAVNIRKESEELLKRESENYIHGSLIGKSAALAYRVQDRYIDTEEEAIMLNPNNSVRSAKPLSFTPNGANPSLSSTIITGRYSLIQHSSPDSIVSCVAPVSRLSGIVQVTEFVEMTLLLGVQHIVLYLSHPSKDVRQLLEVYRGQGLVTILPWDINRSANIWASGRDAALNDCLYRTMFLYDFVLFHDMDEYLVPRATPDLPSLLAFLRTKGKLNTTRITDIVFNSAFYAPPTKAHLSNLTSMQAYTKDITKFVTLRSLHRTYFTSQHTLRLIKPIAAMRVGAGERKKTTFYINPRFAGVNHYAKCQNSTWPSQDNPSIDNLSRSANISISKLVTAVMDCSHTKFDDVTWRYRDKLIQSTKDSIRRFNALSRGQ